ncbi:hypothetical protein BpHYR1_009202 [Brachionus plicatilis]|uniref:Uncharacterized protein n=1 Tax=Brachionus plicatilis TaxID=10195 RepID=A0A3M7PDY1_BRAPC|nr:hypothetical protein BpHYR1_009202 [Brachionus plicatilis]
MDQRALYQLRNLVYRDLLSNDSIFCHHSFPSRQFKSVLPKVQEMQNVHAILEVDFRPQIRNLLM